MYEMLVMGFDVALELLMMIDFTIIIIIYVSFKCCIMFISVVP